jgi:hypothetical protein
MFIVTFLNILLTPVDTWRGHFILHEVSTSKVLGGVLLAEHLIGKTFSPFEPKCHILRFIPLTYFEKTNFTPKKDKCKFIVYFDICTFM